MQHREHAADEDAGLQKHFRFALAAFRRAVENVTGPISQLTDGQAFHGSDSSIEQLAWPGCRPHPGTAWQCSRRGTGRGRPRDRAIKWAHFCFLLLGSGSGDWAAGEKVATPEHQATAGCKRPTTITKTCCSLVSPPQRPISANAHGFLCPRWHRSRSFGSQPCSVNGL